ncbi:HlyD family type I secretion periplasmic adaptor subunit [Morganella psychrotolerans]|uniref:Membrane fusion protein (MFP) family protein n=1 Tax=Morganella psychrotolerans TaxID=368603 RepID=A0A5M9R1F3_9GAMM|nr:HlyD family type I secretion periplasmic adaptor subunit [Morganella psychrotolerans]KAA8714754.1 HlyD family type I secretion periplasmic adaptor subunit [Morganella psychrotolerans]OBU04494.1 secretion protein HlyD [Morganella psychrotolerans]
MINKHKKTKSDAVNVPVDTQLYRRAGGVMIIAGFCGFLLWAGLAPLDKGVAASGTVIVSGSTKQVQSPVDGVISAIQAENGQRVDEGQVLVSLSPVQSQARRVSLAEQLDSTQVTIRRLEAELSGQSGFTLNAADKYYAPAPYGEAQLQAQNALLTARRLELESEIQGWQVTISGLTRRLVTLSDITRNKQQQLSSLTTQTANLKSLAEEGYLAHHRYLEIAREKAVCLSQINENRLHISQAEEQKASLIQRIAQRQANFQQEARETLARLTVQYSDLEKQRIIETDLTDKHQITAPVSGTVMDLSIFTHGGVVRAGEKLMSVVPQEQTLIIDGKLSPQWRDKVASGYPVDLIFTAFNQNRTPKLRGELIFISADRLTDPDTREPYYQIQVAVVQEPGLPAIKPGMPVDIFIKTGERSLLSYLFRPVTDRLHSALAEE